MLAVATASGGPGGYDAQQGGAPLLKLRVVDVRDAETPAVS
jgi:hypothetical protein